MLVATGVLLGAVLLVMAGEEAQEAVACCSLAAHNRDSGLGARNPITDGVWFSVFPTIDNFNAQARAGLLVLGSYLVANRLMVRN